MVNLTVKNILFEYDEPMIVVSLDAQQNKYICLNSDQTDEGSLYVCRRINKRDYSRFVRQEIDLLFLLTAGGVGKPQQAVFYGYEGEHFRALPLKGSYERYLPERGFFLPKGVPETVGEGQETRQIKIDGRWGLDDLRTFSDRLQDAYAFVYAMKSESQSTTSRMHALFSKHPWRGGYSSLNFFNEVYAAIPHKEAARIREMHYASPGRILIDVNASVAEYMVHLLREMSSSTETDNAYKNIRSSLRRKKWLGKAKSDIELSSHDIVALKEHSYEFAGFLHLEDKFERVNSFADQDPLAAVKILLAFYRKMSDLLSYIQTGKAHDLFSNPDT